MIPIKRQSTINIRERMIMWRDAFGLTQKELADKCGVGQPYISYLESGQTPKQKIDGIKPLAEMVVTE